MTIATSVQSYLARNGVPYDVLAHEHTWDSMHSAQAAHIPGDRLAKCVVLEDEKGFLMAVIPATHRVDLGALHRALGRSLGLATDRELIELFKGGEPQERSRVYNTLQIIDPGHINQYQNMMKGS